MKKRVVLVVAGLCHLAAPAFADPKNGESVYQQRCNLCHGMGLMNAPVKEELMKLDAAKILDSLNNPKPTMAGAIAGLSDDDKKDVADYLTAKPDAPKPDAAAPKPDGGR